jgi:hypothetical protein
MDYSNVCESIVSAELSTKICRHIIVDNPVSLSKLNDDELISRLDRLASAERKALPEMLACLSAVEDRGLHLDRSFSSMLEYCVERLKWSEGAAMQRLVVAKTAALYPEVYSYLQDGLLNLSAVSRLSAHLTPANSMEILSRAAGRKRAYLDEMLKQLRASSPAAVDPALESVELPSVDVLPFAEGVIPADAVPAAADAPIPSATLLGPIPTEPRERLSFLANESVRHDLDRSRRLLKRRCPSGSLEDVVAYLLRDFLRRCDPSLRAAAAERPPRERQTRGIPQWVKDRVWKRDGGCCTYASLSGRRCTRREMLEYDHILPWARGGSSDDPENIRLLCRAHNLFLARRIFGGRVPPRRV